ncbi:response regulator [Pedobacter sp. AW1-32]|uniref:response regulator n=1 Tax=Pedobacter sp. AW1-32 TaxID=3383026 RepID=UPI003FEDAD19
MKKKILAIDDDEDILYILEIVLEDAGFHVVKSSTGLDVSEIVSHSPDLLLLDVRISGYGLSGSDICNKIKHAEDDILFPVILLSAEHDLSGLAQKCGADGFIRKPFDIDRLVEKVRKYVTSDKLNYGRKN